ncbi:uncharacterized protein JCM10292_002409 [Rhodotorula paludigena]|uniref:uncharacterized protein n=1 Tax=Rhodotorula paludigena TaxID=86838 RepID=UPI00316EFFFB
MSHAHNHFKPEMQTAHDLGVLLVAIKAHGKRNPATGKIEAPYGEVFKATEKTLEALNGTLRSAKRQKKVTFEGELLMMPKDKDVLLVLLDDGSDAEAERKVEETLP